MDKYETTLSYAKAHLEDMRKAEGDQAKFLRHFNSYLSSSRAAVQFAVKEAKGLKTDAQLKHLCDTYPYIVRFKQIRGDAEHQAPVQAVGHLIERGMDLVLVKPGPEIDEEHWQDPVYDTREVVEVIDMGTWDYMDYQLLEADLVKYGLSNDLNLFGHCRGHIEQIERMLAEAREQKLIP